MSTSFYGNNERSVDEKGRLILPAEVREQLSRAAGGGAALVTTIGEGGTIAIYTEAVWGQKVARLEQRSTPKMRRLKTLLFSHTQPVVPDKQGRIALKQSLLDHAGVDVERARDVVIVGAGDRFEIWSRDAWQEFLEEEDLLAALDEIDEIEHGRTTEES